MEGPMFNESEVSVFYRLPIEVISYIMTFLPYADLKNCRLVCNLWYEASQDPRLLARDKVLYEGQNLDHLATMLAKSKRRFPHFKLIHEPMKNDVLDNRENWTLLGPHIQTLVLSSTNIKFGSLLKILLCCSNLRELEIQELYDVEDISLDRPPKTMLGTPLQLPKLSTLRFVRSACETIYFDMLLAGASNIRVLIFEESDLHFDEYSYGYVGNWPESFRSLQTLQSLRTVLMRGNSDGLIDLSFLNGVMLDDQENVEAFLGLVANVNLVDLYLKVRSYTRDGEVLKEMARLGLQKGLKTLQIDLYCYIMHFVPKISDIMEAISTHFMNLRGLGVPGIFLKCVPHAVPTILRMKDFTTLLLQGCFDLEDSDVLPALCSEVNLNLRTLALVNAEQLSPECIVELARMNPALINLNLEFCGGVNDWSIQAIFRYQLALRSLNVRGCFVTDAGLLGLEFIPTLDLSEFLGEINATGCSLSQLTDLRSLCLGECEITDVSLERAIKLPRLERLDLSSKRQQHFSIKAYHCVFRNNPTIKTLALGSWSGLLVQQIGLMFSELYQLPVTDVSITVCSDYVAENRRITLNHSNGSCVHFRYEEYAPSYFCASEAQKSSFLF